jgi:hypothetical protein
LPRGGAYSLGKHVTLSRQEQGQRRYETLEQCRRAFGRSFRRRR